MDHVAKSIDEANAAGSVRLFSMRDDFPTEWARFQGQPPAPNQRFELVLNLRREHYPFWSQDRLDKVSRMDLLARSTGAATSLDVFEKADASETATKATLTRDAALGNLLVGQLTQSALPSSPVTPMKLFFEDKQFGDLWVAVTWGK